MRSRFTAFAVADAVYLRASWHPSTRPNTLEFDDDTRWLRLDVLEREAGGPFDDSGVVEFDAHYRDAEGRGVLHERSHFVREAGAWYYLDGVVGGIEPRTAR